MAHLTLAGVSDDGSRLLLVSDAGGEFTLDLDARLRAACRGETSRLGQVEMTMSSALRPRDIQTRIRGGESPESVAEAAGTTVEKIMPYAGPVLAEREHMAERAQKGSLRRRSGEGARVLGEAVATHLRSLHAAAESVEWDAWRRDDGRWEVVAGFSTPERTGTARFTFDVPGNYALADEDDARWLVGEQVAAPAPAPHDDLAQVRQRRAAATDPTPEQPVAEQLTFEESLGADAPLEAFLEPAPEPEPGADATPVDPAAAATTETDTEASDRSEDPVSEEPQVEAPAARRPVRKSRGRASVPSWDEIMFGGSKD
ncbi:septation protein SepH [Nocardioides acrostichi]|uniref:DUF3071 domain-containing protein n=1 Tax=Nocardioides acrostichi TaxID=2784339 RepID=A0A930UZL4_9ACTN|nr:septation protein SepH [Nocardioides acrostichi]MBF4160965.1 DUF3071 domain-containing protein [Nocardioides acrostichi]